MRLPTATAKQREWEDARQLHERLYAAHLEERALEWPVPTQTTCLDELLRISGNLRKFWAERRFRVRTRVVHRHLIWLWLEEKTEMATERPRMVTMQRARKVGPVVAVECAACGWRSERRRDWETFSLGTCVKCEGEMRVRTNTRAHAADAKAKQELAEQGAA